MSISFKFLEKLIKSNLLTIYQVPIGHYNFEYAMQNSNEVTIFGLIELEHNIISDLDNTIIGHFGVDFDNNILVYYLKM